MQLHFQTFKATVFRRTLPCMLGTWHKNDFHTGSVVLIPFFLLHMHVHGVVQNKQTMPCFHRKLKTIFKKPMLLKRNPAPKMKTNRKMVKNLCKTKQKKQQFDKNCSAVSPKLLSSLVSSFTKLLSSLAKLLSSLAKSSAVSPNCSAVW